LQALPVAAYLLKILEKCLIGNARHSICSLIQKLNVPSRNIRSYGRLFLSEGLLRRTLNNEHPCEDLTMKFSLLVESPGTYQGKSIVIRKPEFVIGRDPGCDLRPQSEFVSHRHCAISIRGDQAFVRDFTSTNGTFLNDQQVQNEVELKHGDTLRIESVLFRVNLHAGAPADGVVTGPGTSQPAVGKAEGNHQSAAAPVPPGAARAAPAKDEATAAHFTAQSAEPDPGSTLDEIQLIEETDSDAGMNGDPDNAPPAKTLPVDTTGAVGHMLPKHPRRAGG
jgi:predicted component of type VI protein secretion system